jgi:hypothetical protein
MRDAAKIIAKLNTAYPCTVEGCEGTARMTLPAAPGRNGSFIYQCGTCGTKWHQNGHPVLSPDGDQ